MKIIFNILIAVDIFIFSFLVFYQVKETSGLNLTDEGSTMGNIQKEEVINRLHDYERYYASENVDGLVNMSIPDSPAGSRKKLEEQFRYLSKVAMEFSEIQVGIDEDVRYAIPHDVCAKAIERVATVDINGNFYETKSLSYYCFKRTPSGLKLFARVTNKRPQERNGKVEYINLDGVSTHLNNGFLFLFQMLHSEWPLEKAEEEFKMALEYDETDIQAYSSLGIVYYQLGRYEEAEQHLKKALELFYKREDAIFVLDKGYYQIMVEKYLKLCQRKQLKLRPFK